MGSPRWLPQLTRSPRRPEDPRHALGRRGEKLACRFLRRKGYKILRRNFRAQHGGEVDVACRHGQTLVFVEIKTRGGTGHGRPADAVNAAKQRLIIRGAQAWLRMLDNPDIPYRFDIVEVVVEPGKSPVCNIVVNAFTTLERFIY